MKRMILYSVLVLGTFPAMAENSEPAAIDCTVAREYITAFNYLTSKSALKLAKNYLISIAEEIAKGCSGAAKRFITSFEVLQKAELDSKSALSLALEVAQSTAAKGRAFLTVFKSAYAKDILDLDVYSATQIAKKLVLDATHSPSWIDDDFYRLSRYCVSEEGLAVDRPSCAGLVVYLLDHGVARESEYKLELKDGVAKPFISGFKFLTKLADGPQIATYQALGILKELIAISPYSIEEFLDLYKFLVGRSVQPLTRDQAIDKARAMAKFTAQHFQNNIKTTMSD